MMTVRRQFSRQFELGTILASTLIVFVVEPAAAAAPAAFSTFGGLYIGEHIWVKAPQLIPLS